MPIQLWAVIYYFNIIFKAKKQNFICPNKMEKFWILILMALFSTNLLDKSESVKLELKTFDEIFGEGWWEKGEAEDLKTPAPTNFGQNVPHQIDRQNTEIGQIEPNSTDQLGEIEPNSTDQNPPLTKSDHSDNAKNGEEKNNLSSNESIAEDERKRKIIDEFRAMKDKFKQKGKYSTKEWNQIEENIAKYLKVNRTKIFEWKKEFGLSQKMYNFEKKKEERKHLIVKFDQMKAKLKRAGFKNSYKHEIDETVAKELGLSFGTISNWKRKLGQSKLNHIYGHSEQKELMKLYYEWKRQFKRQQFHPNSVDGHFVEENAAANVQEIGNSNSGKI